MTQISQSSSTTSFSYDNGNRRTSLTLPNNVVVSYTYDNDSRVTGITYQFGSGTLGNLTYAYDQLGRRTQAGGSFAGTGLPGTVSSATYDAANELTRWNGIGLTYDGDGNMLSDGSNTFAWNARNQVASLNNVSLQYDAFGRRVKNLAGTSFLYDGANAVQELSGTTVTANLLSGGIDEVFSRSDSSGSFSQLKDALGSTIALVDSGGNVDTSYTYDPYGNTSVTGTGNANEFQYTGRENESGGLYYYRNRYHSPLLVRFISQDPIGFAGGINSFSYVGDDPVNVFDPFGTDCWTKWFVTWCNDPPGASETFRNAERPHEKQHRDDFWNGNDFNLSCGELEYRGYQAEIPVWRQRIDDLSGRYSSLTPKEKQELQDDRSSLSVAQTQTVEFLEKAYCGHDAAWRQREENARRAQEIIDQYGISLR